jgi:uncharacterized protein YxeA
MNSKPTITLILVLAACSLLLAADSHQDMLTAYYKIHQSYAADSTDGVADAAALLAESAVAFGKSEKKADLATEAKAVSEQATRLKTADLEQGREIFKDLSKNLALLEMQSGNKTINVFYCPMARAYWLQPDTTVANPYFGKTMAQCGRKVDKIR